MSNTSNLARQDHITPSHTNQLYPALHPIPREDSDVLSSPLMITNNNSSHEINVVSDIGQLRTQHRTMRRKRMLTNFNDVLDINVLVYTWTRLAQLLILYHTSTTTSLTHLSLALTILACITVTTALIIKIIHRHYKITQTSRKLKPLYGVLVSLYTVFDLMNSCIIWNDDDMSRLSESIASSYSNSTPMYSNSTALL